MLAQPNTFWLSYRAISIGYLVSCPLSKLGEVARITVFRKQNQTPLATLLSTVFVDRVLDFMALLIIIIICFTTHAELIQTHFPQFSQAIAPITIILISSIIFIILLMTKMDWFEKFIHQRQQFNPKHKELLLNFLKKFRDGFQYCKGVHGFIYLISTTLIIWSIYFCIMVVICHFYPNTPKNYQFNDFWIIFFVGTIGALMPVPGGVAYPLFVKASMDLVWPTMPEVDRIALSTIIFLYNFWGVNIILGGISMIFQISQQKTIPAQIND